MATRTIISTRFDPQLPGGGNLYSVDLAQQWLGDGHSVHIVTTDWDRNLSSLSSAVERGELEIHEVQDGRKRELFHVVDSQVAEETEDLLESISPDSVHVHNFAGLLSASKVAVDSDVPTVYTALDFGMVCLRSTLFDGTVDPCSGPGADKCPPCFSRLLRKDEQPRTKLFKRIPYPLLRLLIGREAAKSFHEKHTSRDDYVKVAYRNLEMAMSLLPKFSRIIAPSPIMEKVLTDFGARPSRVRQIVYGVNPDKITPEKNTSRKNEPLRLRFLGHTGPSKGFQVLFQALNDLPEGLDLQVVAHGNMEDRISEAPAGARRYLRGGSLLEGGDVGEALRNSDGVIVPSIWHENSPFVVLEALANRRPVIASERAGISHLITDAKNGRLLPPGDASAWAHELEALSKDPDTLRRMFKSCVYDKTVADYKMELEKTIEEIE